MSRWSVTKRCRDSLIEEAGIHTEFQEHFLVYISDFPTAIAVIAAVAWSAAFVSTNRSGVGYRRMKDFPTSVFYFGGIQAIPSNLLVLIICLA